MNFAKKNYKLIIGIIIGAVLISGISVYATTTYLASQVTYKNDKTVEQALDDLYSKMLNHSIISLESDNLVSSISCSIGDYFLIQTIYGDGANIDGLAGCQIIASCIGPEHNWIDSRGVLVRATSTTISATNQFGYIKLGIQ